VRRRIPDGFARRAFDLLLSSDCFSRIIQLMRVEVTLTWQPFVAQAPHGCEIGFYQGTQGKTRLLAAADRR
jgi:hypothetical protein